MLSSVMLQTANCMPYHIVILLVKFYGMSYRRMSIFFSGPPVNKDPLMPNPLMEKKADVFTTVTMSPEP